MSITRTITMQNGTTITEADMNAAIKHNGGDADMQREAYDAVTELFDIIEQIWIMKNPPAWLTNLRPAELVAQ